MMLNHPALIALNKIARPLFVGGCVRDHIMGNIPKDFDIEVHNISIDNLANFLSQHGECNAVGKSFGVLKLRLDDVELDFSIPRRENKVGVNHTDFHVELIPNMGVEAAAARRDFTINSMAMDIHGNLIDPFGGEVDLRIGVLRHTSEAFAEDPLRVLRGFQFCSRFHLKAANSTLALCKSLAGELHFIAPERQWEELKKFCKGDYPEDALSFLREVGFFEPILRMAGCEQDPHWHPEGDVLTHTGFVCEEAAKLCAEYNIVGDDRIILMLAALLHDVGKPSTTMYKEDRIVSPGHAEVGAEIAREFLGGLKAPNSIIEGVSNLVLLHMRHVGGVTPRLARRLLTQTKYPHLLIDLMRADHAGRPPLPPICEEVERLATLFSEQKVEPLIKGKDLLERGFESGPAMGQKLKELYELQINLGLDREALLASID